MVGYWYYLVASSSGWKSCLLCACGSCRWLLLNGLLLHSRRGGQVSRILTHLTRTFQKSSMQHSAGAARAGLHGFFRAHKPYCNIFESQSMPPSRLFLFLANSFTLLSFSQSFLIVPYRLIQFCSSRFKTHTMPLSPSSIVDFVDDDNTQDDANVDTRAFPSDPSSSNIGTERVIQETGDLIRVAVLGTGMMGQVRFRVYKISSCWWRWRVGFPIYFSISRQPVACYRA